MNKRIKVEIVKVQVPIMGGVPGCVLVYDRHRKHCVEQPISKEALAALRTDLKGYFNAQWFNPDRGWVIADRVGDQPW